MRRKDREIINQKVINDIIQSCECCRLGFADGNSAYIVPLSFGYSDRVFYFHGAKEGRKIDLIKIRGYAGFELDRGQIIKHESIACEYSYAYQSVIGEGRVTFVEDAEEKKKALNCIMEHYSDKKDWDFPLHMLKATCIFKLEVDWVSGKERK